MKKKKYDRHNVWYNDKCKRGKRNYKVKVNYKRVKNVNNNTKKKICLTSIRGGCLWEDNESHTGNYLHLPKMMMMWYIWWEIKILR